MSIISRLKIISQKIVSSGGSGAAAVWGAITGTLSSQTDLQNALDNKLNLIDFPAQFSIELDGKTTADLAPSTDRNYVTNAELAVIQEVASLHSGSINIDFGTSGDFLTTAVVGQQGSSVQFDFEAPIIVNPGEFVGVMGKILSGAATASQVLQFVISPNLYHE